MKKIIALCMALVLSLAGSVNVLASDVSLPYVDVYPQDWYYDAISYVRDAGLMYGKDETHFVPYGEDGYLQRQDLAVIFGRHYTHVVNNQLNLSTTNGAYYTDSVEWVKKHQIMNGYANGDFGVGDIITRQDFVVALNNYINQLVTYARPAILKDETVLGVYEDAKEISSYAVDAMYWNVLVGVINGYENDDGKILDPHGPVTRGMAAVMLERFFEYYNKDIIAYARPFVE